MCNGKKFKHFAIRSQFKKLIDRLEISGHIPISAISLEYHSFVELDNRNFPPAKPSIKIVTYTIRGYF